MHVQLRCHSSSRSAAALDPRATQTDANHALASRRPFGKKTPPDLRSGGATHTQRGPRGGPSRATSRKLSALVQSSSGPSRPPARPDLPLPHRAGWSRVLPFPSLCPSLRETCLLPRSLCLASWGLLPCLEFACGARQSVL